LKIEEREIVSRELSRKQSARQIGKILGRHHSTISREIDRNGGAVDYRAVEARDGLRIQNLFKLAEALGVQIKIEAEPEGDVVKEQDSTLLLPLRDMFFPVGRTDGPADETELTLARLRQRVLDCTADYDRAHYAKLAADIPALIHSIDLAVGLHENEARAAAYRLLAHAHMITARVLIHLRDESLMRRPAASSAGGVPV
jgi:hypothetical protein